jgi:hemerythrin superfamily protein
MHDQFFEQLKRDHNEVKSILNQMIQKGNISKREELKKHLQKALVPHMRAEEHLLYPALKSKKQSHDLALEALEEHHAAELVFSEIFDLRPEHEVWSAKCEVLKTLLEHHINEEEQQIYRMTKEVISEEDMGKMLTNFAEEKIWYTTKMTGQ